MNSFTKYKSIIWYGLIFVGLIGGILFEAQYFLGRVTTLTAEEAALTEKVTILRNRKNALSALEPEVLAQSNKVTEVLPTQNSSLIVSSQVRSAASENNVTLRNYSSGVFTDPTNPDLGSLQVGMVAEGESASILKFLETLTGVSPYIAIETINMSQSSLTTIAQLSLRSFWSPLPTQLPALTEPLQELSQEERQLLQSLEIYKSPVFSLPQGQNDLPITVNPEPFAPVE